MDIDRLNSYDKEHCWQYDIRLNNLKEDLEEAGFTEEYVSSLKVSDFDFKVITEKEDKQKLKAFIERHE